MTTDFAVVGRTTPFNSVFVDNCGVAIPFSVPVKYVMRDFLGNAIAAGTGIQDTVVTGKWYNNITIPQGAPLTTKGQKYTITWTGTPSNGAYPVTYVEDFPVVPEAEYYIEEANQIVQQGQAFSIHLRIEEEPEFFNINIADEKGNIYYSTGDIAVSVSNTVIRNGREYIVWNVPATPTLIAGNAGCTPYFINWQLVTDGILSNEINNLYIINYMGIMLINNLRHELDKIHNYDLDPGIRFKNDELFHYVLMGIQKFNSNPPYMSNYTLTSINNSIYFLMYKCALSEALSAWLLAEAMLKFDFQGQAVQLNVDRTGEIQNLLDMTNTYLEEHVRQAKKILIRSSGAGALMVNLGAVTNYPGLGINLAQAAWRSRLYGVGSGI